MAILTKKQILAEMKKGRIKIEPFNKANLGPASYDLTLDNNFRIFEQNLNVFNVTNDADYKKISHVVKKKSIILEPGDFVLGVTKETIDTPGDICGWLSGRSRFARLGVGVHVTANFVQPNIENKQVLEIKNLGNTPLKIPAGLKLIQIIFERTEGSSKYVGRYGKQKSV